MLTNFVEVPYNWRKAKLGYPRSLPTLEFLQGEAVEIPEANTVFLPWGSWDDVFEIRNWLVEYVDRTLSTVQLYGRFGWYRGSFETKREFLGLSFVFRHSKDFIYFKLRWQPPL